jgi:exodeoxyribonuclease VII small subunit
MAKKPDTHASRHTTPQSGQQRENDEGTDTQTTFEEAMQQLEEQVCILERDDLTLEQALESFEKGVALMRTCSTRLKDARGRVTQLLRGEQGEFIEKELGFSADDIVPPGADDAAEHDNGSEE